MSYADHAEIVLLGADGSTDSRIRSISAVLADDYRLVAPADVSAIAPPGCALLPIRSGEPAAWSDVLENARVRDPGLPILAIVARRDVADFDDTLRSEVDDFVTEPFDRSELLARVKRLVRRRSRRDPLVQQMKVRFGLANLVGESPAFLDTARRLPVVARCDSTVLIRGETGTGKEVFARAIHYLSPRSGGPFLPVNCGAIPTDLIETELFGHERGAFTGASRSHRGLVGEARGGTLFLDEIDCLTPPAQVKLLRLLQENEYRAVGSVEVQFADVRFVAATAADLRAAVAEDRLRSDLYYRLDVLPLTMPPLRERGLDALLLADHFASRHAERLGRPTPRFTDAAKAALLAYEWPGNVRELDHVVEQALVLSDESPWIESAALVLPNDPADRAESFRAAKARAIERFETTYVENLLGAYGGNITRAARAAQKHRRAFFELIRKHGIDVGRFRRRSGTAPPESLGA